MLLRREVPSWLYQVAAGATTVWERWDAIRPDGTIHEDTCGPSRAARRDSRRPHAVVQPLRLWGRGRLDLSAFRRDRTGGPGISILT